MQLSFSMLFAALAACLLGYVAADPLIVTDSVSGNKFYLPTGYPGTFYDAQYETIRYTYQNFTNNPTTLSSTSGVMSTRYIIINVTWAGDVSDTFTFNIPGGLTVAPLASAGSTAANCNVTTQTTLTSNNRMCIYNISWAAPLTGTFAVVYVNSSFPVGSETVAITFANNPSPAVVGDPQFVGLRGQSYQVHGIDGAVYNLITEAKTQVNSRFAFLTQGECPIIKGVAQSGCWSHPGSYMGDMSFQAIVDGKLHSALITAGSAKQGLAEVEVDGKALAVGDKVAFGAFSVSYTSTHGVAVTLENYNIELSNSDMFLNLALTAKAPLSKLTSHGLIGQTHANKVYKTSIRYIEGEVDDYLVAENDAFGTTFPFNRFQL